MEQTNFSCKYDVLWKTNERGYGDGYIKLNIPSVSKILSLVPDPEFDAWKEKMGDKAEQILIDAGNRGTAMHCFLEHYVTELTRTKSKELAVKHTLEKSFDVLSKENIPVDKINKGRSMFYNFYYSSYANLFDNIISSEMKLYSPRYLFRGAIDVVYRHDNKLIISDFKSSSSHLIEGSIKEKKYKLQLGGYALMLEDKSNNVLSVNKSSIICLSTNSDKIQEIFISGNELNMYKEEFLHLVYLWHKTNNQNFLYEN